MNLNIKQKQKRTCVLDSKLLKSITISLRELTLT